MSDDARLLRTGEVAKRLGVNRSTVTRMCRRGELPCVQWGQSGLRRSIRIPEDRLEEWIEERLNAPRAQEVAGG